MIVIGIYSSVAVDVIKLSDRNFTEKIGDYSAALVKFYVPWCGHCKTLAPDFKLAAKALRSTVPPVHLIEVDCSEDGKHTCSKNNVKGYPTLKVFKYGELAFDYVGPKYSDGILQYMKSSVLPASAELKSVKTFDEFLDNIDNSVIGFFESGKPAIEIEFHRLADSLKDQYRFAHTYHSSLLIRYGYRNDIVLFRSPKLSTKLEQPQIKYEGETRLYKFRSWVTEHYIGLVGVRTSLNMEQFRRPLVIVYYKLDFTGSKIKETSYWRNRIMMAARKFSAAGKRKVYFAVSDAAEFSRELSDLGLTYNNVTPVIAARDTAEHRYIFHLEFTIENLRRFVDDLIDGKLVPYIKSSNAPDENDGLVKIVVGSTFNDIVNDETKDVLIYFHAPWCDVCPTVGLKLGKLAKKLKKDGHIVIASMDATKNDVAKEYVVKRFPSIFFASRKRKRAPKLFEGELEVDELMKFVSTETTLPLQQQKHSDNAASKKLEL